MRHRADRDRARTFRLRLVTLSPNATAILLPLAVLPGLALGLLSPAAGEALGAVIDPLVLSLLVLLFFEVRFQPLLKATRHLRFLSLAWAANFLLIPLLGWGIASLFFGNQPALFAGLLLYFLFPCTDWFLGFTRMAKGDVALGAVLLPINLLSQLLLFPVYLTLFIGTPSGSGVSGLWGSLWQWFLLPFAGALLLRFLLSRLLSPTRFETLPRLAGSLVPWILAALVCCVFGQHAPTLLAHPGELAFILPAVFLFFLVTWLLGEFLARRFRLAHGQKVLLAMTTAARNTPLVLGLTMIALPDQPLIYAALILGMLVEFPHLTALSRLLSKEESQDTAPPQAAATTS
ncbi:MAG: hypothetical protein AAF555_09800 [Verrucomicrobiota bacterium]